MNDPATIGDGRRPDIVFEPLLGETLARIMADFQHTPTGEIEKAFELGESDQTSRPASVRP